MLELIKRALPLAVLLILFVAYYYFNLDKYISFQTLQDHHQTMHEWTNANYLQAVIIFMLVYIFAVALSVPGAVFITLAGGFLFGVIQGVVLVVISATLGATLIFLIVQTSLGKWLQEKASNWIKRMRAGFQQDAFSYLLTLRLIPIVPFWVLNIVPALLGMNLRAYVTATALGIIPASFIYVSLGNGLSQLFAVGKKPDLSIIFTPSIILPLLGLALLALLPTVYKKYKKYKGEKPVE